MNTEHSQPPSTSHSCADREAGMLAMTDCADMCTPSGGPLFPLPGPSYVEIPQLFPSIPIAYACLLSTHHSGATQALSCSKLSASSQPCPSLSKAVVVRVRNSEPNTQVIQARWTHYSGCRSMLCIRHKPELLMNVCSPGRKGLPSARG